MFSSNLSIAFNFTPAFLARSIMTHSAIRPRLLSRDRIFGSIG